MQCSAAVKLALQAAAWCSEGKALCRLRRVEVVETVWLGASGSCGDRRSWREASSRGLCSSLLLMLPAPRVFRLRTLVLVFRKNALNGKRALWACSGLLLRRVSLLLALRLVGWLWSVRWRTQPHWRGNLRLQSECSDGHRRRGECGGGELGEGWKCLGSREGACHGSGCKVRMPLHEGRVRDHHTVATEKKEIAHTSRLARYL